MALDVTCRGLGRGSMPDVWGGGGGKLEVGMGSPYSEVQCIMNNSHMRTPPKHYLPKTLLASGNYTNNLEMLGRGSLN